jgi:hypothetical protein
MTSAAIAAGFLLGREQIPDQEPLLPTAEAIRHLLLAERTAKDLADWDTMASAFASEARVRVSWFDGSGTDFVAGARARAARGGTPSFHEIGAVSVVVNGPRALADAPCAVHIRGAVAGVEVDVVSRGRLCWRVVDVDGAWRIRSMDMVYFQDSLSPVHAGMALPPPDTGGSRPSYRFLRLLLASSGFSVPADLPGLDRPDLVDRLVAEHLEWFSAPDRRESS